MTNQSNTQIQSILRLTSMALLLSWCALSVSTAASWQEENEEARRVRDERFFKDARAGKRPAPQTAPLPRPTKPGEIRPDVAGTVNSELIGVTFWRLSPAADERRSLSSAKDEQNQARLLIPDKGTVKSYHAARISDGVTFSSDDLLWLGIEVPRPEPSYVYVIDREEYKDGTLGKPYLIFPTPTTPDRANIAGAGEMVYVPAAGDRLPYLRFERNEKSRSPHIIERLTIIVSPHPLTFAGHLEELAQGVELLRLDVAEAKRCDSWGGKTRRLDARGDAGKGMTLAEKEAGERRQLVPTAGKEVGETRRLVPTDLLPQTIYEFAPKPGSPVLLNVRLRIAQ